MTPRQRKIEELATDVRRTNTLSLKTQVMQQGAQSEPVQAYLSEFLSKIGTHLLASSDIMENQIGTLLLASEMPVPISG